MMIVISFCLFILNDSKLCLDEYEGFFLSQTKSKLSKLPEFSWKFMKEFWDSQWKEMGFSWYLMVQNNSQKT